MAAAVRTAGLEKTPAVNSCWAFWKLAPVRRYREWICRRGRRRARRSSQSPRPTSPAPAPLPAAPAPPPGCPPPRGPLAQNAPISLAVPLLLNVPPRSPGGHMISLSRPHLRRCPTRFSITIPSTAMPVKKRATSSMSTATAVFAFSTTRAEIQPLSEDQRSSAWR